MSHFHNNALIGASGQGGGYNLESSLRFRASASAYLSRTPTTAGNRKTFTYSAWVKRGVLGPTQTLFGSSVTSGSRFSWEISSNNELNIAFHDGTSWYQPTTSAVFRDPSAWYHIVVVCDLTQGTSSNRIKVYVNGNQQTLTGTYPPNYDSYVNSAAEHRIGNYGASNYFDGYLTEINFVDGQALTPSDFGETNTITGVWKPKEYTGTYGTNGFYLPMKETQQATGFNTVLWAGNSSTRSITGVGFSPDLVWIKNRSTTTGHQLTNSVVGALKYLSSNSTDAEDTTNPYGAISAFNSDGFTLSAGYSGTYPYDWVNKTGYNYVAWCWDAGSSTVSNTDGSITSSVRANPATGFSVVTYTGTGSAGTIGHGLSNTPDMIIVKRRNAVDSWFVYHSSLSTDNYMLLNGTNAVQSLSGYWGTPSTTTFGASYGGTNTSSGTFVAYCFAEVAGYSKFGSYTGNGSASGPTVTLGFRPAFVMVKRTDSADEWAMHDNTRDPDNKVNLRLRANSDGAELTTQNIDFNDNGFQVTSTSSSHNASGGTYIYMAFADTRDAQFNFDASGNKNNWTATNINSNASSETTYDIMNDVATLTDEDTANFPILNQNLRDFTYLGLTDANLQTVAGGAAVWQTIAATMAVPTSGKYYWETKLEALSGIYAYAMIGILPTYYSDVGSNTYLGTATLANAFGYYLYTGAIFNNNTANAYGNTATVGDVIGVAVDADNGKVWFSKNGTWQNSGDPTNGNDTNDATSVTGQTYDTTKEYYPALSNYNSSQVSINFGQRPFKYTPPTGYKKLNTYNLPNSNIVDGSDYFNTVTYTGNGSTNAITVGFQPDFIWIKRRNGSPSDNHVLQDSVRGLDKFLITNSTNAEASQNDSDGVTSYDTNGFTLGYTDSDAWNSNSNTYVAWNWRGSDSAAVTNTDGSITSTVSANPTSGFSVVTYTSQSSGTATVGHGLGVAPKVIIHRNRNVGNWIVYHESLGATKYIVLDSTGAEVTNSGPWNNTAPTSSVFTAGSWYVSSLSMLAYCFAEVEGFSKFGSYTGNGSADGPFIYTGFRPAFVMIKNTTLSGPYWVIVDTARETFNVTDSLLFPNDSLAETTNSLYNTDLISNGFKIRNTNNSHNTSGDTFIYMAFAENPFKNSLAR